MQDMNALRLREFSREKEFGEFVDQCFRRKDTLCLPQTSTMNLIDVGYFAINPAEMLCSGRNR